MTKPTPQDFIEAAYALQDVAAMDKKPDTDLLADAVKVIEFYAGYFNDEGHRARDFLAKIER